MVGRHERAVLALIPTSLCVPWPGHIDPHGYGSGRAHRRIYRLAAGPIPEGQEIDHLCHTEDETCLGGRGCLHRRCVNPAHMELVTHVENILRGVKPNKRYCSQGHAYDERNTYIRPDGTRDCRACSCERQRRYQAKKRVA